MIGRAASSASAHSQRPLPQPNNVDRASSSASAHSQRPLPPSPDDENLAVITRSLNGVRFNSGREDVNLNFEHNFNQNLDNSRSQSNGHNDFNSTSQNGEDDLDYAEILDVGKEGEKEKEDEDEDERKKVGMSESDDGVVADDDKKEEDNENADTGDLPVFYDVPSSLVYTSPSKK